MTLEEAVACLANYNANPLPWHCDDTFQSAEIASQDGISFFLRLDDHDGPSDSFSEVNEYLDHIGVLRSLGLHRWCSSLWCCIEVAGKGASCRPAHKWDIPLDQRDEDWGQDLSGVVEAGKIPRY